MSSSLSLLPKMRKRLQGDEEKQTNTITVIKILLKEKFVLSTAMLHVSHGRMFELGYVSPPPPPTPQNTSGVVFSESRFLYTHFLFPCVFHNAKKGPDYLFQISCWLHTNKTCESHVPLSKDVENQNARLTAFQCTYTKHSLNLSLHVAKVEAGNEELATFTSRHKFKELS